MPKATYKRRPDGRYQLKFKGRYFYGDTVAEAQAKKKEYERLLDQGVKEQEMGITVATYSLRWVSIHKAHVNKRTYDTHVRILNRFIALFGACRMRDITPTDIQTFYNQIPGKSKSSINDTRDTIKGLFKAALADRVIVYDPCLGAVLPKGTKGTHRIITQQERQLIHATQHKRMRAGVMVMLYAGLRRGEALALQIERDVNFDNRTISVREAVRFDEKGLPVIGPPKTEAGIRTIPLPDLLVQELRGKTGLLIQSAKGDIMSESSFDRAWQSYIASLETQLNGCHKRWYGRTKEHKALLEKDKDALPPWQTVTIRPHDLRHSYRTMLYDMGVDTESAMKWLGHADVDVSVNTYTHLSPEREALSVSALQNGLQSAYGRQNGCQQRQYTGKHIDL